MSFLDLIVPPRCFCAKIVNKNFVLCPDCWKEIDFIVYTCRKCGAPCDSLALEKCQFCHNFVHGRSVVFYRGTVTKMITHFKYYKRFMYGKFMAYYMSTIAHQMKFDVIVVVPLSFKRLLQRGYHHTAILGQEISRYTGKPLIVNCLKKRHTKKQVECSREERLENVKGSFYIATKHQYKICKKKVLLIDA